MTHEDMKMLQHLLFKSKIGWIDPYAIIVFERELERVWRFFPSDRVLWEMLKVSIEDKSRDELRPMLDYMLDKATGPMVIAKVILITNCLIDIRWWVALTMTDKYQDGKHQITPIRTALGKLKKLLYLTEDGLFPKSQPNRSR